MYQGSQSNSAENAATSSYMVLNSQHHETHLPASHVYNIPPPNMYIPSYMNYAGNCPATLTDNQHPSFLVPPYPPPNVQSNLLSQTNYGQVLLQNEDEDPANSFPFEMQYSYTPQKEGFVNIPNMNEANGTKLQMSKEVTTSSWIETFLPKECEQKSKRSPKKLIKIWEAKECYKQCFTLLQDLEDLKEKMKTNWKDMTAESWNFLCENFSKKKNEFVDQIEKLPDPIKLKETLEKRHKKRECQRTRNKRKKEAKVALSKNRQVLHHKIDTWLKFMQETIDRHRREESLKKEADSVLSEVLKKKADGRRQLSLLEALIKLRKLRAKTAVDKGQHVPSEDGVRFEKVAENLTGLWDKQLMEYNIEEQGMRVMLSEAVDERDQSQASRERQILSQWNKLLFGTRPCDFPDFYMVAEKNVEAFINIRHSWDKFTVSNKASMQSNIPVGWILPENPSTSNWESLLSPEKTKT